MAELTHAQNGEDTILLDFFRDTPRGTFVDVGAYDGITYSNSYLLERRGWTGVCIEPNPNAYQRCAINRTCTCLQAAVVADKTQRTAILRVPNMEVLATLDSGHDAAIQTIHENVHATFAGFKTYSVPAFTLDSILAHSGLNDIDLLSIDTEWTNADVLAGVSLKRWRPRVIVIETGMGVRDALSGYHVVLEHGSNYFAVRDSEDVERMVASYKTLPGAA